MNTGDFDIESLARHLHISPEQVLRMAERGKLPGRRIGGQWRFAYADIHHWWEDRIGVSSNEDLILVEEAFERHDPPAEEFEVSLSQLLSLDSMMIPLPARTRGSVIKEMVALAVRTGLVWDAVRLEEAIRTREILHPTALDIGVALLHPRRPLPNVLAEPFLALGRTSQGVPFGHPRGMLTDVFFLIGSTDDYTHLRILARLSRLLSDASWLGLLRADSDTRSIRDALLRREQELYA